jgi:tetratricopeptide (TPR) repeat protein
MPLPFLQQAQKVNPRDGRVLAALGMTSFMSGNYQQAIDFASQSLAVVPDNPGASMLLIASYIRTNQRLDEAERMINKLEASGVDRQMISGVREDLAAARGNGGAGRTMLDHGPEDKLPQRQP